VKLSGDVPYWRSTPIRCECTRPPPAPKHPGAALMRFTAFPSSKPARFGCFGMRDAIALCSCCPDRVFPCERWKQNAPGWEPEGVRVASGRSGWPISRREDQSCRSASSRSHGARTDSPQRLGCSAKCFAMWAESFMA